MNRLSSLFSWGSCLLLWLQSGPPPKVPVSNNVSSDQNDCKLQVDPQLWSLGLTNGGRKETISPSFLHLNCEPFKKLPTAWSLLACPALP